MTRHLTRKLTIAAVAACMLAAPAAAQQLTQINVLQPSARGMIWWPVHVGEELGYYEEEGLSINLLASETTIPYVAFLTNKNAHLAMLDGPQTYQAVNAGVPIRIVYEMHQRAPEGVAVSCDNPLKTVAELKGKTVGLVSDRDLAALEVALSYGGEGLTSDDMSTVVVGESGPILANAFRKNTVDAVAGSISDFAAIKANGQCVREISPAGMKENPANSWAMLDGRQGELKDKLCGFFRAQAKGAHVGVYNIEAIAAISRKKVPEQWQSKAFGYNYLEAVSTLVIPITKETYGKVRPDSWKAVQEDMIKIGEISKRFDVNSFLDHSFTECANDFDRAEVEAEVDAWMKANSKYVEK